MNLIRKTVHRALLVLTAAAMLGGCNTVGGSIAGAGIGYVLGDAEFGADVGAAAGLVKDIWG